jgi:hypothetical protein
MGAAHHRAIRCTGKVAVVTGGGGQAAALQAADHPTQARRAGALSRRSRRAIVSSRGVAGPVPGVAGPGNPTPPRLTAVAARGSPTPPPGPSTSIDVYDALDRVAADFHFWNTVVRSAGVSADDGL